MQKEKEKKNITKRGTKKITLRKKPLTKVLSHLAIKIRLKLINRK